MTFRDKCPGPELDTRPRLTAPGQHKGMSRSVAGRNSEHEWNKARVNAEGHGGCRRAGGPTFGCEASWAADMRGLRTGNKAVTVEQKLFPADTWLGTRHMHGSPKTPKSTTAPEYKGDNVAAAEPHSPCRKILYQ